VDKVEHKSAKTDIPFALRRGTIGQVTTHLRQLRPRKCAAEDELAANEAGLAR
jgi:hypothetical protein